MWNRCVWLALFVFIMSSCGSKKKLVPKESSSPSTANIDHLEINNLDFKSFSGRAKTRIEFGTQKQDVTLNFRIEKDKAIWISVTALLGIEAVRVMITPDSVKILNKLQGEYIKKPFSYIYRYTNPGISFATLQDLLLANVSKGLLRTDQLTIATSEDELQLVGIKDQLSFQYSLNTERRPRVFRLLSVGLDQTVEAFYGKFTKISGYDFPQSQQINLSAEDIQVKAQLEYSKVEFNEILEFPFVAPSRYKVIE